MECMLFRTSSIEAAYLGGVYVILILKAWQVSKGQQSLTKLNTNTNTSSKYLSGFSILARMAVVEI
jgi:cytosine/uracil/thiamine/allantoin permease